MKLTLTNEERHLRKALIGCILVFIFESYQGHRQLPMSHVHSGYQMLKRWLESKSCGTPISEARNPQYNSAVIEPELLNIFTRLHTHTISTVHVTFLSTSLMSEQEELDGDAILSNMPAKFSSMGEAQHYMLLVLKRANVFFAFADGIRRPSQRNEDTREDNTSSADFDPAAMAHTPFRTDPLPNVIIAGHAKYSSEFSRAQEAFSHLYTLPTPPPPIMMLYGQTIFDNVQVYLNSLIVTEECEFDKYIHDYRNLVLHAKQRMKVKPVSVEDELTRLPWSSDTFRASILFVNSVEMDKFGEMLFRPCARLLEERALSTGS